MNAKTKRLNILPWPWDSKKKTCPEIIFLNSCLLALVTRSVKNLHQISIFKPQFLNLCDSPYMLPLDSSYTLSLTACIPITLKLLLQMGSILKSKAKSLSAFLPIL